MFKFFLSVVLAAVIPAAVASECSNLYPNAQPITPKGSAELCNRFYVSVYDTQHNAVLLTSERLSKTSPVGSMSRINSFRADGRVGKSVSNATYLVSGYDKGHMAPADDASSPAEMRETFLLSNMTPQEPTLNRVAWKQLEERVRLIWQHSSSDVIVLTIAEYKSPKLLKGTVPIPAGYWKIVYADGDQHWFYAKNKPYAKVNEIPVGNLDQALANKW